ncbi:exocyst complex component 2 [Trichonephila inaurata madagascariensis]|uniref:Exocyst complex component 2 n=1 Tax=Trichonephila inaurata madagascariensis TaxID=2747483 RepID=A0A8X6XL32_9ARAC|nr:exocyst complex component 2 [Trichonephila inaurata madagascariensis]
MEPPKVTGLSPKEGEPGTKVTIRGENLGTSQRDLLSLTDESAVWVDESWFGKNRPTSPSQLYPDDPLRLSDESSVERFPVDELQELFPEGSGDILSPNFQPIWYLLEITMVLALMI